MKLSAAMLLAALLSQEALAGGEVAIRPSFLQSGQPVRCGFVACAGFAAACEKHDDCVSMNCYEGKCANAGRCRPAADICYTYSAHTCCTGECEPVMMKPDCKRLLAAQGTVAKGVGVSLDRQCQKVGVCKPWPGAPGPPSPLSMPWAVPARDVASKYNGVSGLTFAAGVTVRREFHVARRTGQEYQNILPDSRHPGSVRDAGVINFSNDSVVALDLSAQYLEGGVAYCVAPILRNGLGGGYYAVGKGCCESVGGFSCGDAVNPSVKSGLVIAAQQEKFSQAVAIIESMHGFQIHHTDPDGTPHGLNNIVVPIFVHIVADFETQRAAVQSELTYVVPEQLTRCVAPVWDATPIDGDVEFWAAGNDCCSQAPGDFHCGDVDVDGAHSGSAILDQDGGWTATVLQAKVKYLMTAPARPMFVHWTQELLVATPR